MYCRRGKIYIPKAFNRFQQNHNFNFIFQFQVDLAYEYDRIETVNGSGEYFKYDFDVKPQEGSQSVFIIQANIEQLIDLDNEWKVSKEA